jgi:hypothetical protein
VTGRSRAHGSFNIKNERGETRVWYREVYVDSAGFGVIPIISVKVITSFLCQIFSGFLFE